MSDKNSRRTPASRGGRFMKLAGMTASVAGSYAKSRVRSALGANSEEHEAENWRVAGERIAQTLGELKGAVMKVGQVASQARDLFPAEIADALATLQNEAPPMPFDVISDQIEKEFGTSPDRLFKHFEAEPFAAASIGQVHRATTDDGQDVVVKVQYPGVDASCDSDLAHLKLALRAAGIFRNHKESLNDLFDEMRERLHEELDYTNEAENIRLFQGFHANDEGIVIPSVIGERSSKRVLTMTYEPGDHIDRLDPTAYDQETRNLLGRRIFQAFGDQIFVHKAIHGDPHPGNFAYRPDGTLVIYDFGCVKKLKPEILPVYTRVLRAGIRREWQALDDALIALGARTATKHALGREFYEPWRDLLVEPFSKAQPYDYKKATLHQRIPKMATKALKHLNAFQVPTEAMFVDRAIGGHYYTMMKLGVVEDFRPYLLSLVGITEDDLRTGDMW